MGIRQTIEQLISILGDTVEKSSTSATLTAADIEHGVVVSTAADASAFTLPVTGISKGQFCLVARQAAANDLDVAPVSGTFGGGTSKATQDVSPGQIAFFWFDGTYWYANGHEIIAAS